LSFTKKLIKNYRYKVCSLVKTGLQTVWPKQDPHKFSATHSEKLFFWSFYRATLRHRYTHSWSMLYRRKQKRKPHTLSLAVKWRQ